MAKYESVQALIRDATTGAISVDGAAGLEVFRVSTRSTAAISSPTDTVNVENSGGFAAGSLVWVEGDDGLKTIASVPSATSIQFTETVDGVPLNGAVVLASVGGTMQYATLYKRSNFGSTYADPGDFPIVASDNEINMYVRGGRYGQRVSDASNNTLQLIADVDMGSNEYLVNPQHTSDTAGIQEAINVVAAQGGGVVRLGPFTYTILTDVAITIPANVYLCGSGLFLTTIARANTVNAVTYPLITFTAATSQMFLSDLTVDGNVANNASGTTDLITGTNNTDVTITRVRAINSHGNGIYFTSTGGNSNLRISIYNCDVEDITGWGICVEYGEDSYIDYNKVRATGQTGIGFTEGPTVSTDTSLGVSLSNNNVNRSAVPTLAPGGGISGALIDIGGGTTQAICANNIVWDNQASTAGAPGIAGAASPAAGTNGARRIISGNVVGLTKGPGIEAGSGAIVSGNSVFQAGTDGVVIYVSTNAPTTAETSMVTNNLIVDPDEEDGGAAAGIKFVLDSTSTGITAEDVKISGNQIQDGRDGAGRLRYGIFVQMIRPGANACDMGALTITDNTVRRNVGAAAAGAISSIAIEMAASCTMESLIITGADMHRITSSGTVRVIEWIGAGHAGITSAKFGTITSLAGDAYSGSVVVSADPTAVAVNWPTTVTWIVRGWRILQGGTTKDLAFSYDGASQQVRITGSASVDTSTMYWELVGTA